MQGPQTVLDVMLAQSSEQRGATLRLLAAILASVIMAIAAALALAPRQDVLTSIDIAAPPDRVWAVLTDTAAYPAWNPGMMLKGALNPGTTIENDEGEGAGRMVFHPVIVAATPNTVLSWRGHLGPPRVLDVLHYFTLAPLGTGTRFTQGEHLRGVVLWMWDWRQLVPRFQAMNAALKARVERLAAQP
jgi:hypothetical protein